MARIEAEEEGALWYGQSRVVGALKASLLCVDQLGPTLKTLPYHYFLSFFLKSPPGRRRRRMFFWSLRSLVMRYLPSWKIKGGKARHAKRGKKEIRLDGGSRKRILGVGERRDFFPSVAGDVWSRLCVVVVAMIFGAADGILSVQTLYAFLGVIFGRLVWLFLPRQMLISYWRQSFLPRSTLFVLSPLPNAPNASLILQYFSVPDRTCLLIRRFTANIARMNYFSFVHNPTKCRMTLGIWTEQRSRKYHFWAAHPKWVASIPGTRKTRSGRHFFLSTRFCLLAAMRFGRPKKRRGRGLDHSFATYALLPVK